jgi:hypothetical protein
MRALHKNAIAVSNSPNESAECLVNDIGGIRSVLEQERQFSGLLLRRRLRSTRSERAKTRDSRGSVLFFPEWRKLLSQKTPDQSRAPKRIATTAQEQ